MATYAAPVTAGDRDALPGPLPRGLPWLLLLGGLIGLVAAFVLTVEKIALIADPTYRPSCSLNPVLSCGSVMATPQASVFGFPNSLLGVAGFAVVTATGAALLAGARLRGWYWLGLQAGATGGVVFVHWLIGQSLYRIGALCPYCMAVWAVTIPIFFYVTLSMLDRSVGRIPTPIRTVAAAAGRHHGVVLTAWVLVILALIVQRFWSFWVLVGR
ncbi:MULTISPECIES: vitamin K epoxide reductase family protein [unclassified Pseudonocardia]|uniref:vitamin K epoxide reductase family protein n=1 Tax=unclassified Pseudonocardia TaxID=2619320 RepID=UPI000960CEA8|nr:MULTISPECIES: vitamin K epoxide reductase family protein [unclassified Pseudonocardia]OJY54399.1 MAG: Vitamin K epoxide reductase [Pseudonocardia sp. 73-21]